MSESERQRDRQEKAGEKWEDLVGKWWKRMPTIVEDREAEEAILY
jgi:hypothetical protein